MQKEIPWIELSKEIPTLNGRYLIEHKEAGGNKYEIVFFDTDLGSISKTAFDLRKKQYGFYSGHPMYSLCEVYWESIKCWVYLDADTYYKEVRHGKKSNTL